jgi:hypothetical protein
MINKNPLRLGNIGFAMNQLNCVKGVAVLITGVGIIGFNN